MYEIRCDCCDTPLGDMGDKASIEREAVYSGWVKRGKKVYCAECKHKTDSTIEHDIAVRSLLIHGGTI